MNSGLHKQIREAQAQVRKMKRAVPYIFPEHTNLRVAEDEFRKAKENLRQAKEAWKNLGQPVK
jgi:prefoldin subunit 5